jgi:2-polyprenyl-6-methoxyphenol hydroxylase-like FAD-dependent oxidoreductase
MAGPRTALIVGAGIGGLAAGLALRRAGWEIRIVERAATPRELGFALALAPNAMAALHELGIAREIAARSSAPARGEVRRLDGRRLRRFVFRDRGAPPETQTHVALRPVVHGALLDAVGIESVDLISEAAGAETTPDGVVLTLTGGRTMTGDVLIGADGVGSAIRRCLHAGERPPRPSGYWSIRGVAPDAGRLLGDLSGVAYFGPGVEAAAAKAGPTAVYWYMSLLAADVPAGSRDARAELGRRRPQLDATLRSIIDATAEEDLRMDELLVRDPLPHWGHGRITLLGDAAHPVLPHTGQGAAQALEDAVALGLSLAVSDNLEAALRRYESVRSARTRRFQRLGPRIARITTTRSPVIGALRTAVIRLLPASLLTLAGMGQRDPHRALRSRQ